MSLGGAGAAFSAYLPPVLLVLALRWTELGWIGWFFLAAGALAVVVMVASLASLTRLQERPLEAAAVRRCDDRVLAFTAGSLTPALPALLSDSPMAAAGSVALLLLMCTVHVRAGLYHLNPLLALAGWRLYEVTATNGAMTMLLSRQSHVAQRAIVRCRYFTDDVALVL